MIATYAYLGPPVGVCGGPAIVIVNGGQQNIGFLVADFDSVNGIVSISVPNSNNAVKGDYTLDAVFSQPGSFSFPLGLTL